MLKNKKVNSFNEWDPLEEIIIGRADFACIPKWNKMLENTMPTGQKAFFEKYGGQYFPQKIIDKANEELDNLASLLKKGGVKVKRPVLIDWKKNYRTPDFESPAGLYSAMP
jgi:glycine amidinotransferase